MTFDDPHTAFDFRTPKDGVAGESTKWTALSSIYKGAVPDDPIPMWVAQMDFQPAPCIARAAQEFAERGEFGYFTGLEKMFERVAWWTETRHGWAADPAHMLATHGLGNAIGMALQALTEPGDGIIIFTPVYHEFTWKIQKNDRKVVESPLVIDADGLYRMDLDRLQADLDGTERVVMMSSPHNPAGRVWEPQELRDLAAFCARNDLLLISDEIHQDLTFPGHTHVPTAVAAPESLDRLIVMSAASKTFDIAGLRTGTVIIPDDSLRQRFGRLHRALDTAPNRAGVDLTHAAYTPEGAKWVDALRATLDENHRILRDGFATIPGAHFHPMQSTYLAWVDFSGTGMDEAEVTRRIHNVARVVPTPGPTLGTGGALHRRFNFAAPRTMIEEAISRLQEAFSDLQ